MASITVCGTATISVVPDRAVLEIGLTDVALTASAALAEVAAQSQRLAVVLSDAGFVAADWSSHGVTVAEEWEWKHDTNTRIGFRATSGVTVQITVLERIAPVLQAAVDEAGVQIRDLRWSASDQHPARARLLGAAALDAVHRADAYAEALGLQRGAVTEISDLPITIASDARPTMMMARAKSADETPALSLSGGEIDLHASVHVRFATLPR